LFINSDLFFLALLSYTVGSIPFGLIISIIMNKEDPRLTGSKNIGATNIARTSGWKLGLLTLISDISKSYIPIYFTMINHNEHLNEVMLFLILGHLFPIWLKFRGGKGVAVFIGALLAYNPVNAIVFLISWLIFALIFKYSSLSAILATFINMILIISMDQNYLIFIVISALIVFKHIPNIKRLLNGKESRINFKK
tara:strand:+ start:554 stop:1141 length:588 start_codon:yes stop_codon:yes gene_type:complete